MPSKARVKIEKKGKSVAEEPVASENENILQSPSVKGRKKKEAEEPVGVTPKKESKDVAAASASVSMISPQAPTTGMRSATKKSPGAAVPPSKISIAPETHLVYKLVRKSSGALGGNGATGAIYGELTMHSMQRVIDFLKEKCELTSSSRFIDIGSGLGKPNFHAAQDPACRISIGIELEDIRWQVLNFKPLAI